MIISVVIDPVSSLDALHPEVIDKNDHHKTQHRTLLGKPETQGEAADVKLIEPVAQYDAADEGDKGPGTEQSDQHSYIGPPVAF